MVSQNSEILLKRAGRHNKTESIEAHLLREGVRMKSNKEKLIRKKEETEKLKRKIPNNSSQNSSKSTIDFHKRGYSDKIIGPSVKKTLFFENDHNFTENNGDYEEKPLSINDISEGNQNDEGKNSFFTKRNESKFQNITEYNEKNRLNLAGNKTNFNENNLTEYNEKNRTNLTENKTNFNENNLSPSKNLKIYKQEAFLKEDLKNNKESVDIFNKYLLKKMTHKLENNSNSPEKETNYEENSGKNEEKIEKTKKFSPIVQDPLTLFEKKPYLKPSKNEISIEKTNFSSKNSKKSEIPIEKTNFSSKNSMKNETPLEKTNFSSKNSIKNDYASKKSNKIEEKTPYNSSFTFKEKEENPSQKTQEIPLKTEEISEKKPENSEKLKNMFIDSKSFFEKHHLKNKFGSFDKSNMRNSAKEKNNGSLVWLQYQYQQNKASKATPESLLSSLKYRENKVFSYYENKLNIHDKSELKGFLFKFLDL